MTANRLLTGFFCGLLALPAVAESEQVVLLHGLARSAGSMHSMADYLQKNGYSVCNIDYPSRHHVIETLTADFVLPSIRDCFSDGEIHFVTHSLGGIIVRQIAAKHSEIQIGRVVMLAPPNQGSEVVDKLGNFGLFNWLNGPAGQQLGTDLQSLPNQLGPANFELGVIAGNRSINLILSALIPGRDDGKVAVRRAGLKGMRDFLVVEAVHPLIMGNDEVQRQTLHFLQTGRFRLKSAE